LDELRGKQFFPRGHNFNTLFSISHFLAVILIQKLKSISIDVELNALHFEKKTFLSTQKLLL